MKHPFFSVIIPTYNRAKFLKIAVESVLSQTFRDFELIIVDDGSTDETEEILKRYFTLQPTPYNLHPIKFIYLNQDNKGPGAARNRGLKESSGEFICFLDSDDRFRQDKLEITHKYIKKYTEYKIFHTEEIWYRNGAFLPQKNYHKKPSGFIFENAASLCSVSISTAAVDRKIFDEIGFFDTTLPACEDYDFWLRVTSIYPVLLLPEYLTIKEGGHSDQQSKKFPMMDVFRIYALKKILNDKSLPREIYKMASNELIKKCNVFIKGAIKRGKIKETNEYKELIRKYERNSA